MSTRMVVILEPSERSGLRQLAEMELRSPRDQLRAILRSELESRGLLAPVEDSAGIRVEPFSHKGKRDSKEVQYPQDGEGSL